MDIAFRLRSFLDLPPLLAPPTVLPMNDPHRFQRLDRTFTRKQWLPSILTSRSKLYTGFPSDHYLLVTHIRIKLAQRAKTRSSTVRYDVTSSTAEAREGFTTEVSAAISTDVLLPISSDHTARVHYFTDGSGTRGKCSSRTPAGWGFTYKVGDAWMDASGPVVTDPNHPLFAGALVGSNNTGELTAILEAVLHASQQDHTAVIHSDSLWAINVLKGKWRPQRHKQLVNYIRGVLKQHEGLQMHWIKGHAGHEGNERADKLADVGRQSAARHGATAPHTIDHTAPVKHGNILHTMQEKATAKFAPTGIVHRRPWISDATLQLLADARTAEADQEADAKTKKNLAKRSAKRDKIQWIHDQLTQDLTASHSTVWKTVLKQKRGFRACKTHLIVDDKPVPWSQNHTAFRDHYQTKQWYVRPGAEAKNETLRERPPIHPQVSELGPFSQEELQTVLASLKKNKAPGPDGLPNELFQLLDHTAELALLEVYNEIRSKRDMPQEWLEARVVTIFKGKGSDTDPANYRPIALLNVVYKIMAAMIQKRLAKHMDHNIRPSQFGFRAGKSTQNHFSY